jgi:tetratricopeptide (TPR) repeat protein
VIAVLRIVLWAGLLTVAGSCVAQVKAAPDPSRQQALTLEQQGKNVDAESAWRVYLKAHPTSPEPYAHLGLLEARQEHYKEAVQLYRKALKLGPDVPGLRLNLGLALFKAGDLKQAILEFEPLLKTNPGNQQVTTLVGMAHYGLGEYKEAVPYLQTAAANDKQSLSLRLALAHSCLWTTQTRCVQDTSREILALNPDSAEADMLVGEALDEMKDNAGALAQFRAAVKANPKAPNAHFGLGYLLWSQKKYPEAVEQFKAELANDPLHIQSMLYLADTDIQLNQVEDARPLLEKVEKMSPAISLVHLDLGIVYTEADSKEDALRELNIAAKSNPDDVNVHWRLARLYRAMGKKDLAKAEFDKASSLNQKVDEDLFKKISEGGLKHGPPPVPSPPADH